MNVLIIDDFHQQLMKELKEMEISFDYRPEISPEEVLQIISTYQGLIFRSKIRCDKMFFENAPKMKWIARGGSGLDNIDEEEAKKRNIILISTPEANRDAVAEHTIGLMLTLSKKIAASFNEIRSGQWNREKNRGIELGGKTLGIIGVGNVGSSLAKKIQGFGMNVIGYDKYKSNLNIPGLKQVSLEELKLQADWVSLHIPYNAETHELVDEEFITDFSKSFFLINTSRGKIVKTEEVIKTMQNSKILGFGADVLENENPKTYSGKEKAKYSALFSHPDIVITPHVAGWSSESYMNISIILAKKIRNIFK